MAVWGLDIQQVRALAQQLEQKAQEIDQITSTLTSKLGATQWTGPDATQFRNDWAGTYTSSLKKVSQGLRDAATRAKKNATEQEQASQ